jgi:hypothetical protein
MVLSAHKVIEFFFGSWSIKVVRVHLDDNAVADRPVQRFDEVILRFDFLAGSFPFYSSNVIFERANRVNTERGEG